ncbi:Ubiquinol-cytochrome c reductase iron-sulfur subunit [Halioglobus japonicus]|nr:Ubiquinol-cytochrome c reductase iron-sulfur subunit [Halioglobus japonicus]
MSSDGVNSTRRKFLTAATSAVGAAGVVGVAVPFVGSWNPSAKAKAAGAPVKFDFSKLESGQMSVVEWRGKPVYVVNRTEAQLETLPGLSSKLKDPDSLNTAQQPPYITGIDRSTKPELLVIVGLCTHLGCAPKYVPEVGVLAGASWEGGFFCPCHGSKFDLSGRVYEGAPASANLLVPPYSFEDDKVLVIGVNPEEV